MQASLIVRMLLEEIVLEGAPNFLTAFGPGEPVAGSFDFGEGNKPLADFIKLRRPDAVNLDNPDQLQKYLDFFQDYGYTFVFSDRKYIRVYSKVKPKFGKEAIASMERYLGLTPSMTVQWNGQEMAAAQAVYGQPNHAKQQADSAKAHGHTQVGTFGGLAGPGQFKNISLVNPKLIAKGLKEGSAYVMRYDNGSISVITPSNFKFDKASISKLEATFGITPRTLVKWYQNNVTHGQSYAASVAIYGGQI